MSIVSWPLQKAIYGRLVGNANTSAYTVIANGTSSTFPYIKIAANTQSLQMRNKNQDGADVFYQIDIYGDPFDSSSDMVGEIASNVHVALRASRLDLSSDGFKCLATQVNTTYNEIDEYDELCDKQLTHGIYTPTFMVAKIGEDNISLGADGYGGATGIDAHILADGYSN